MVRSVHPPAGPNRLAAAISSLLVLAMVVAGARPASAGSEAGRTPASGTASVGAAVPASDPETAPHRKPQGAAAGSASRPPEPWQEHAAENEEAGRDARAAYPYTEEQTRKILELERRQGRALAFGRAVPSNEVRTISVGLDAGRPVPMVRAARGYTTAVVFLDLTGAPWPVARVLMRQEFRVGGDAGEAGGSGSEGTARHVVYVAPHRDFDHGNLTVELVGLDLPVSLAVRVDDGPVDYRLAVRIPRAGPNADIAALTRPDRLRAGDAILGLFATGAVPAGAERVTVEGGGGRDRAWRYRGRLYLKTAGSLMAPGSTGFERGPDGEWVHELADTPLAILSHEGVASRVRFRGNRALRRLPELIESDAERGATAPSAGVSPPADEVARSVPPPAALAPPGRGTPR